MPHFDIVFDGPPGPEAGRFVEVEDHYGASISVGEWVERADGYWALRIPDDDESPFARMLRAQRALQIESYRTDPATLEGDDRIEFIRWNAFALLDEIHEMMQEVGWKPWATSRHVNSDAALGEMVDAWHFFMNLLWALAVRGVDLHVLATEFEERYLAKRRVNAERQADGYDGVSGKCPHCKRDLAEAGTRPVRRMVGRTPVPDQSGARLCGACEGLIR